jgi:hypothetical protein
MPRRERDGFVVEEEGGVVVRLPLRSPPPSEFKLADDPGVGRMEADNLLFPMENAAIAEPGTP